MYAFDGCCGYLRASWLGNAPERAEATAGKFMFDPGNAFKKSVSWCGFMWKERAANICCCGRCEEYQGLEVEDKIYPDTDGKALTHEVLVKNRGSKTGLYYKLGEGQEITAMKNGLYAIDDKQYFIRVESAGAVVREVNGRKELIVPVEAQIKYEILW